MKIEWVFKDEVRMDMVSGDLLQIGSNKAKLHQVLVNHKVRNSPPLAVLQAYVCIVVSYC